MYLVEVELKTINSFSNLAQTQNRWEEALLKIGGDLLRRVLRNTANGRGEMVRGTLYLADQSCSIKVMHLHD